MTIKASDGRLATSVHVTISVTDVNERPEVDSAIADQTMTVGVSRIISLQGTFSDPDGDTLTYSASISPSGIATVSVNDRDSTLTLAALAAGPATITVTAADRRSSTDADRLAASQNFAVTVEASLPTVTIAASTQSVGEGQLVPFILSADPVPTTALTVNVSVTDTGSFLTDTTPTQVTIAGESATKSFTFQTTDDTIDEANGTVTATVLAGTGYTVGGSSSASVTVRDDDLSRPPKPESVSASSASGDSAEVRWSHSNGIEVYRVQYREADKRGWRSVNVDASSPGSLTDRTTITSLKCETRYRFRVRGWGDGVSYLVTWGPYSDTVYATTGDCGPVTPPQPPTPTPDPPSDQYAALIEPPGPSWQCRNIFGLQERQKHSSMTLSSTDGRHEAQVELFITNLRLFDESVACVEARFISESTPGADQISWDGKLYKTERALNVEGLNLGRIGPADIITLLNRFEDQPLTDNTPAFRMISRSCTNCRGGTIQTVREDISRRLLKIPTIHARGEHTFNAGSASVALTPQLELKLRRIAPDCNFNISCLAALAGAAEAEISEDVDTGLIGDLIGLIAGIAEYLDE